MLPGRIFNKFGGHRAFRLETRCFFGLEPECVTINAFHAVQVTFNHNRITAAQFLGNGGFTTFFDRDRLPVRH